jgi:peptidylprolyl isomerase
MIKNINLEKNHMTSRTTALAAIAITSIALASLTLSGCTSTPSTGTSDYTSTAESGTDATDATDVTGTETDTVTMPAVPGDYTVSGAIGKAPTVDLAPASGNVSALYSRDIVTGKGAAVTAADTVTVQYVGIGAQTKTKFDSSWDRGQPAQFGLNQVIAGWTQGLVGMKVGGRRLLVIPADLAYGATPPTSAIKPNETLVFVVDLISVP